MKIKQDEIHPQMLLGEDGQCVAMCTSIASAEAILVACNAHDDLVKALQTCQSVLRAAKKESGLHYPHAEEAVNTAIAKAGAK